MDSNAKCGDQPSPPAGVDAKQGAGGGANATARPVQTVWRNQGKGFELDQWPLVGCARCAFNIFIFLENLKKNILLLFSLKEH